MATPPKPKPAAAPAWRSAADLAASADREIRPGLGVAALVYLGLALVYFLPAFLPGKHIFGTDYLAGAYPFYSFISERLTAGELPKWVPHVFGGLPIFSNPGSTYYPVHLLGSLVLPVSRVLPAVFVFQFFLAGLGTYLLARELGCRRWVAMVAGLAFEFTGILHSWVYAGHDGRIIAASYVGILFFFLHRGIRTGRLWPFAGVALAAGLPLLSFQLQNAYYLLLAGGIWAVFCLWHLGTWRRPATLAKAVVLGLAAVGLGFTLNAINLIPFQDYVPQSPRGAEGGRGYDFAVAYSMPPSGLVAMAVPEQPGASIADPATGAPLFPQVQQPAEGSGEGPRFKLHTEYVGAFALVLLLIGAWSARRDRVFWFLAGLSVFQLTLALGRHTPLYRLYYAALPGIDRFRAPDLAYYVIAFAVVVMAALGLEHLARLREAPRAKGREAADAMAPLTYLAFGLAAVALLGAMVSAAGAAEPAGMPSRAAGWMRFGVFAAAVGGLVWAWARGHMTSMALALALSAVTVVDLWIIDRRFFHTTIPAEAQFATDDVIAFLQTAREQGGPFRAWTFPAVEQYHGGGAYGSDFPMVFGVEQLGGEHPNTLQRFNEYVGHGTQTYIDWHNTMVDPGIVTGPDGQQAVAFRSVPGFLEAANVRYVVSLAPLADSAYRLVHGGPSALIYENTRALPRAYLAASVRKVPAAGTLDAMRARPWDPRQTAFVHDTATVAAGGGPLQGTAEVAEHTPDRVVVRTTASRDAFLVLADNWYPGWRATVDGREVPVYLANHTFRGVPVPAGSHTVEFVFAPEDLSRGLWITVASLLVILAVGGVSLAAHLRRRGTPDADDAPPAAAA